MQINLHNLHPIANSFFSFSLFTIKGDKFSFRSKTNRGIYENKNEAKGERSKREKRQEEENDESLQIPFLVWKNCKRAQIL